MCAHLYAQHVNDSLGRLILKDAEDTSKVVHLNKLAWLLRSSAPDSAMQLAMKAQMLAVKLNFDKGDADAYNTIGVIHYRKGEYAQAASAHFSALNIREMIGDKQGVAFSYINLGNVFSDEGSDSIALDNYQHASEMLSSIGDEKKIPIVYLDICSIYLAEKNYKDGLTYALRARDAAVRAQDSTVLAEACNNLGVVFDGRENFAAAMEQFTTAWKISEALDDKMSMTDNAMNIGNVFREQHDITHALEWHFKAENIGRSISYLEALRELYDDLSKDYIAKKNFEEAYVYQVRFKELSDSLFNDENTSALNSITEKWDNDRKEKDLLQKQKADFDRKFSAMRLEQDTWIIAGGTLFALIFFGIIFTLRRKLKNAQLIILSKEDGINTE